MPMKPISHVLPCLETVNITLTSLSQLPVETIKKLFLFYNEKTIQLDKMAL